MGLARGVLIDVASSPSGIEAADGSVRIGIHRYGPPPDVDESRFDVFLTAATPPSRLWVGIAPPDFDAAVETLCKRIERQPVAAAIAMQVLRAGEDQSFEQALLLESFAYSALLGGGAFRSWRALRPTRQRVDATDRVHIARVNSSIEIRLARPAVRNAFDAGMRDELTAALEFALADPDKAPVVLRGEGPAFSAGGDLDAFGAASDLALAHLVRNAHSPARLLHQLGERASVYVHGACIGAGIEIAAGAANVVAAPGAFFRLPELDMGLIPGAGGSVTIPRRIGRHRAAWMLLSGADIDVETALNWGLVDEVAPA
ncbi:MAG: enoyl-CoA hydratase/isomerase family protein [Caulobacterales bacterium]